MKSFTERNPVIIGIVVVALIAVGTGGALLLNGGFFKARYTVKAIFTDSAGISSGDKVRVAGVPSGVVSSVRQDGSKVDVVLKVDRGVELSGDTKAAIVVETLLGNKYVQLTTGTDWQHTLRSGAVIRDTTTPTELLDVQDEGAPLLEHTDAKALNDLLLKVSAITAGKRQDVSEILTGLNRLTKVIDQRQGEASHLISSARTVSQTLAARDQDLLGTVDNLNVVVDGLAARRAELQQLLAGTADTAQKLADLIQTKRPEIDGVLDELHQDLIIVGRHQADLAQSVGDLSSAIEGFASVGYSGPDDYPNRWANIYGQLIGPIGPDALFGSCGLLDDALDAAIGPDPIKNCADRTGPLPSEASTTPTAAAGSASPLAPIFGAAGAGG